TSAEDSDLTALLDAVTGGPVGGRRTGAALVDADRLRRLGVSDPGPVLDDARSRTEEGSGPATGPSGATGRPHLRVVPDMATAPDTGTGGSGAGRPEPGPAPR